MLKSSNHRARDIIREVVRNMREGLYPLHNTTLPPAIHVYLHPEDFERLRGIFSRMRDETRQALDAEMAELNRVLGVGHSNRAEVGHSW
jgi:hypothetical protein